jgi:uncharacterized protein
MLKINEANSFNIKDSFVLSRHSQATLTADKQFQCDCACEGGLERDLPPSVFNQILPESKPRQISHLFSRDLAQYKLYYNPQADAGTVILNQTAETVLQFLDGSRTLTELHTAILEQDATATFAEVAQLINLLELSGLVTSAEKDSLPQFAPAKKLGVWMHVTNQCNLRCTYCYLGKTNERMSFEMGQKVLLELFANAEKYGMNELSLKFAGGEALLEWELVQSLNTWAREEATRRNMRIESILLSNGTTITAPLARQLKEQDFQVAISLDGLDEANDIQRPFVNGRGSARYIERGMLLLQEYGVPFNVSVVVTAQNLANLPQLAEFLLKRTQPIPFTLSFFRDNPLAENGLAVDNPLLIAGLRQLYAKIEEILAGHTPSFSFMDTLLDRVQLSRPHQHACGAGVNYVVVKHTGEISTCQMLLHKPVGKIGQDTNLVQLVRAKGPNPLPSQQKEGCSSCQWRYVCAGGCPIVTWRATGRYDTRSPYCDTYFTLIPEVLRLEGLRLIHLAGVYL